MRSGLTTGLPLHRCAMYSNPKQLSVNEMVLPSEEPQALDNDRNMCLDNGSLLYMSPVIVTI